jgi:hypothetical protein
MLGITTFNRHYKETIDSYFKATPGQKKLIWVVWSLMIVYFMMLLVLVISGMMA